jgi:hypothetical protein
MMLHLYLINERDWASVREMRANERERTSERESERERECVCEREAEK